MDYGHYIAEQINCYDYMYLNILLMWRGREPLTHAQGRYVLMRLSRKEKKSLRRAYRKYFQDLRRR